MYPDESITNRGDRRVVRHAVLANSRGVGGRSPPEGAPVREARLLNVRREEGRGEMYARPASKVFLITGPEDPSSSITGFLMGDATNDGTTPANLLVMTLEPVGGSTGTLVYASASPTP